MTLMGIRRNLGFGKAGFKNCRKSLDNSTASKSKRKMPPKYGRLYIGKILTLKLKSKKKEEFLDRNNSLVVTQGIGGEGHR